MWRSNTSVHRKRTRNQFMMGTPTRKPGTFRPSRRIHGYTGMHVCQTYNRQISASISNPSKPLPVACVCSRRFTLRPVGDGRWYLKSFLYRFVSVIAIAQKWWVMEEPDREILSFSRQQELLFSAPGSGNTRSAMGPSCGVSRKESGGLGELR